MSSGNPRRGSGTNVTQIDFRFFPNGTSTSALTVLGDHVTSVIRTSNAGEFTVTLNRPYYKCVGMQGSVQHPTGAGLNVEFGTISNLATSTNTTLIVWTNIATTKTDITGNANASVSVSLVMEDSLSGT